MAITDVPAFTHLTDADIENLGNELDAIRLDIEDSRGERDSRYIRRTIAAQRALEVAGRLMLAAGSRRSAWWAGTVTLGVAKIIENMEIGHNVMHGQWDWMNDPEIHSSTWEWDMSGASKHWRFTHNFMHHKYTNILGMDDDVGYGVIRVTRDAKWTPFNLYGNLLFNTLLAIGFEWGVGLQHLELGKISKGRDDRAATMVRVKEFGVKAGHQLLKDYVAYPALTSLSPGATYKSTLKANAIANVIRNVWANAVIFCGHFPDGAEKFTKTDMVGESKGPVVPATDAGQRQLRGRARAALHERQPVPPDRAPPVPGPAEQPVARDQRCASGRSARSTTCRTRRAISRCSTARRGAPSPSCRCRTSTCATPRDDAPETRSERMFDRARARANVADSSRRSPRCAPSRRAKRARCQHVHHEHSRRGPSTKSRSPRSVCRECGQSGM